MENRTDDDSYKQIPGWGIDADPENDPTYPMKNYTGDDHKRINYERPPLQPITTELLRSNERPTVSAVHGTSTPPTGISGMLRRYAFTYSEGSWGHWLPLILADRVNVVEGIFDDLGRGHIPNVFKERGWKAEWKHNRPEVIKGVAITVGIAAAVALVTVAVMRKKRDEVKLL